MPTQSDITTFILQLVLSLLAGGGVAALIVFGFRTWLSQSIKSAIRHEYDQKLETHKAQLKGQSDLELERLKSQLSITATERSVRFSGLHQRRLEILAEAYSLLERSRRNLEKYINLFPILDDQMAARDAFTKSHNKFIEFYTEKIIFFPTDIATRLDNINNEFRIVYSTYFLTVENKTDMEAYEITRKLEDRLSGPMNEALQQLAKDFRQLLGDHE
jgi:hypothetical protein